MIIDLKYIRQEKERARICGNRDKTCVMGIGHAEFMALLELAELGLQTEPRQFHIWSEGYRATGESAPAHHHGMALGRTFKDACANYFMTHDDRHLFDADRLTFWGCKLFDNETDARKAFG